MPYPIAALVGYTNAGKSTLFNRMTQASVLSADMLFATLDPTLRAVDLPSGLRIILSDTVGFIADLPTMLVAAFRATLEEVIEADLILHVRDVSHEDAAAHRRSMWRKCWINSALSRLNRSRSADRSLEQDRSAGLRSKPRIRNLAARHPTDSGPVLVSALSGEGLERLASEIEARLATRRMMLDLVLSVRTAPA